MSSLTRTVPEPLKRRVKALLHDAFGYGGPMIRLHHRPRRVRRRGGDLLLTAAGRVATWVESVAWRLDGEPWQPAGMGGLRAPRGEFTADVPCDGLAAGDHRLEVEARGPGDRRAVESVDFRYEPSPDSLPLTEDWTGDPAAFETDDGHWETTPAPDGSTCVRPVPGTEGYDRILMVTGLLSGGRRVETTATLRREIGYKEWGYGVLPAWAGRPDDDGAVPRRGWLYGLGWWFNAGGGAGLEISRRSSAAPPVIERRYEPMEAEVGRTDSVICEAFPHGDGWRLRLKWWPVGTPEPAEWLELDDADGCRLPDESAVALVCYGCNAEFGPVTVTATEGGGHA